MPNIIWQMPNNSWLAHLWDANENYATNVNFDASMDPLDAENSKIDKFNAITDNPNSIMLIVD